MVDMRACPTAEITVGELIEEFIEECHIQNLSPQSVDWYQHRLRLLFRESLGEQLSSLTLARVKSTLLALLETRQPTTVNGYIAAAKRLCNYAIDNDYAVTFSPRRLKKMKAPQKLPPCFTVEQVEAMLRQPDRSRFSGLRDYTMMSLLLDVGIRLGELTGLELAALTIPYLTIQGKGSKQRIVAMSDVMVKRLRTYLRVRQRAVADYDGEVTLLFPSRYGTKLSHRRVSDILKGYGEKAGVRGVRVSAHTFRFTYTTMAVRAGMSLTSLQTCLGHSTLAMTRHYAVVSDRDAFAEARACSPLAAMGKR